jgi:hypothetical protein
MSVRAVEDIRKGAEITQNYIATSYPVACVDKRPSLLKNHGFICSCNGSSLGVNLPNLPLARYRGFSRTETAAFEKKANKASIIAALSQNELDAFAKIGPWWSQVKQGLMNIGQQLQAMMLTNGIVGGTTQQGRDLQVNACQEKTALILKSNNMFGIDDEVFEKYIARVVVRNAAKADEIFRYSERKNEHVPKDPVQQATMSTDAKLLEKARELLFLPSSPLPSRAFRDSRNMGDS